MQEKPATLHGGQDEMPEIDSPQAERLLHELQARLAEAEAENVELRRLCAEKGALIEALSKNESSFRAQYNDTPVMLHSIDRDGVVLGVSNYWLEVLGYRRDEVIGRRSTDFLTAASRSYAEQVVLPEFFRTGFCRNINYQLVKKSGEVLDVLLSASAERDAQGEIIRSFAVMTDVTEWKAAETALKASEERFRMIVETSQEGILGADAAGTLTYVNRQFAEMLGLEVGDVLGRPFIDLVDTCLHDDIVAKLKSREQGVSEYYETILVRKDGSKVWASVSAIPVKGGDGEYTGSFAMVSDITRRKQAAEEIEVLHTHLSARACELEMANEDLEAFSYTVSHDLRRPLTAINGYSQVIIELFGKELNPQCKEYVQEILKGSIRMNHLIDTLLNFSRRNSGNFTREELDLSEMVQEIMAELSFTEPQRKVTCIVQPGVRCEANSHLLHVVLDNLLGNAWKYSAKKADGVIEFGVTEQRGERVYFIRDNGAGFDMGQADRLFTPFQRLHTAQDFLGTGIGLASVQRIIERHGGEIWAEGEPGKGATFYFTLG
ncbi:MAG TPA: PAS domain-containing sensor histidine kinase [Geobacter sp.]|nr:PAS domain-containing sensor histidine kinase [Geobacter sp.]